MSCSCPAITFSLGNGLPASNPAAIPNSDGSYGTFVISTAGNYLLQNSPQMQITHGTLASPNTAIKVTASFVKINLCGHVMTGSGNLTAAYLPAPIPNIPGGIQNDIRVDTSMGINVASGVTNVEIYNGTLQYFSYSAINATSSSDINLHDLLIQNSSSVTLTFPQALGAIGFTSVSNSKIDNVVFQGNRANDIKMHFCASVHISNTSSEGLLGGSYMVTQLDSVPFVTYGVEAVSILSANLGGEGGQTYKNIKINNAQSLSTVFGMYISGFPPGSTYPGPPGIIIENCLVTNISTPAAFSNISFVNDPGTCEMRGIAVEGLSNFATVQNCQVSGAHFRVTTGPGSKAQYPPGLTGILLSDLIFEGSALVF